MHSLSLNAVFEIVFLSQEASSDIPSGKGGKYGLAFVMDAGSMEIYFLCEKKWFEQ